MSKGTEIHRQAIGVVGSLLADWHAARAELAAIERAEHPDLVDKFGRTWTWWKGTGETALYRHCQMAWTRDMVADGNFSLPRQPYADMCPICKGDDPATD